MKQKDSGKAPKSTPPPKAPKKTGSYVKPGMAAPKPSAPNKQVSSSGSPGGSYRTSPQNRKANDAQTNRDLKKSFDKYGSVSDIKTDRNGRVISASTGWSEPSSKKVAPKKAAPKKK